MAKRIPLLFLAALCLCCCRIRNQDADLVRRGRLFADSVRYYGRIYTDNEQLLTHSSLDVDTAVRILADDIRGIDPAFVEALRQRGQLAAAENCSMLNEGAGGWIRCAESARRCAARAKSAICRDSILTALEAADLAVRKRSYELEMAPSPGS